MREASLCTSDDQRDEEQEQAESEQALFGQDLQVLVVRVQHERRVLVKGSGPVSQREEPMLCLELVQVVLAESHTEPGVPRPDQEGLHPDHQPPPARVGRPAEIHRHDEQQPRHGHEHPPRHGGRGAEQEPEQRDRGQREKARRRPGEEETSHGGNCHERRREPSPSVGPCPRERWIQGNREDQPRGDELRIPERGEGSHLAQRLEPEIQFPGDERLGDAEQRDREGRPVHDLRKALGKRGRPQPKVAEREQQQPKHEQAVAQPRFRSVLRSEVGGRGAGAEEKCCSKGERWGEAAHGGDAAPVQPVE